MATIVNTPAAAPAHTEESASGMNWVVGLIVLLVVAFLLFYFGLPLMRSVGAPAIPQQINNNAPPQGGNAPQINVPDKVNVDVNGPK